MEKCVINVLGTNYRIIPKELKNADIDEDAGKKVVAQLCYLFDEKTARQVLDGRLSEKM